MSDQEKSGHNVGEASSVVMVDQEPSSGSRHKTPFRPTELPDEQPDQPHIRSTAPAVPTVVEELKENTATTAQEDVKVKEQKDVNKKSSEGHKRESKKSKRRNSDSPENIELDTIKTEPLREKPALPSQPIPMEVMSITSAVSEPIPKAVGKLLDEDELAALSPQTVRKTSEWSDEEDEEAGGLPRSLSRASRVSRVVRQLFCCGTAYSPPSEDDVSTNRMHSGI